MGSSPSVATVMMFTMVHKNAKMFKTTTTTTTKPKLISCRLDRTSLVKRNIFFFFIQYKSLALILIESNYFYLGWERKPTVKAFSGFDKLKYNMF